MAAGQASYHDDNNEINLELTLGLPVKTPSSITTTSTTAATTTTSLLIKSQPKRSRTLSEMLKIDSLLFTQSAKRQITEWPRVSSHTNNNNSNNSSTLINSSYKKVAMDGVPYLRKINLKAHSSHEELLTTMERMFEVVLRGEYIVAYMDEDENWMLSWDMPWETFVETCNRMRIMKPSDAGFSSNVLGAIFKS